MKTTTLAELSCTFLALLFTCAVQAATVSWTGAAGDNFWNTPGNWTGGNVPGPGDDVILNVAGNPLIIVDTVGASVRSIQCSESLRLDDATVSLTGGTSTFSGPVEITRGWLSVDGADTVMNVSGPTTLLSASCYAYSGAKIWFTNVTTMVVTNGHAAWQASGASTEIHLSNLTNVVSELGYTLGLSATDGGLMNLRRLANLQGHCGIYASSPGSVLDLSNLGVLGSETGVATVSADGGGIILVPKVTKTINGNLTLSGDSQIEMPLLKIVEGSSFGASAGAKLWLTNLTSLIITNSSVAFSAAGEGSEVHAFNITNVVSDSGGFNLNVSVDSSGRVDLGGLTHFTGTLSAGSYGVGSVIDLSGLSGTFSGPAFGIHSLTAQSGGVILMPQVTGLKRVTVSVSADGQVGLGSLTTLETSTLYAYEGARLSLTDLTTIVVGDSHMSFTASGAGSLIDLSNVTNMVSDMGYSLGLSAVEGGKVDLRQLVEPQGPFSASAHSSGSVVDLSAFSGSLGDPSGQYVYLSAAYGGIVLVPQITALYSASVTVTADGAVEFGALTNVAGCSFTAYEGAKLWLTNLTTLTLTNGGLGFSAQGVESAIYLSNVTNVLDGEFNSLSLTVGSSGFIDLHRLRDADGGIGITVYSEGSTVDLSGFTGTFAGPPDTWHSVNIQGGTVLMPGVNALDRTYVYIYGGGSLVTDQFRSIVNSTLTVDAATNDFSRLTNIVTSTISASTGAKLWFTNATTLYITNGSVSLNASGIDSGIYFPNVTNVVYSDTGYTLSILASDGGEVDLHRLHNPNGPLSISCTAPGSQVDLSALSGTFAGSPLWQQSLTAGDQGSVLMPGVHSLDRVNLYITGDVGLPLTQWHAITRSSVNLYAATNTFSSLTNINATSFSANNAAKLSLPGLTSLVITNSSMSFQAWYEDSAIYLPNLLNIVMDESSSLYVHAYQGGVVDLKSVGDISGGWFTVLSRWPGAVVDLSGLTALTPRLSGSSLTADQGGVILLNENAVLIYNVGLNFESSPNSIIPNFVTPGTEMVLYAQPWNAYLIEARDTRAPNSPWTIYLRVPMTNTIQTVAALPPPDLAFRVTTLLADPPALRIDQLANQQTQLTLFGLPGQTYRIESKSALGTAEIWQNGPTVTLTNAFRIFPGAASADPSRYNRARKL